MEKLHRHEDLRRAIEPNYSDFASVEPDKIYGYILDVMPVVGRQMIRVPIVYCPYCGEKIGRDSPHIVAPKEGAPNE